MLECASVSAPSVPEVPAARRGVGVVWAVIFVDLLGFGIVLPSLAYYVHMFPVPAVAAELGARLGVEDVGAVFVGLIQTAYSLLQLVCAPLWGRLSDRIGRKPVLTATMAGFAIAWTLFAFAPSLAWLLAARALAGAFGANVSTAQAYIADVYPPEQRARGMGLIGMAFGLGFVFGPAIGALLASDVVVTRLFDAGSLDRGRLMLPALFSAGFSLVAFGIALLRLPESLPPSMRSTSRGGRSELAELVLAVKQPGIGPMLFVYFIIVAGFANMETMFSQFNLDVLALPQSANGLVFTLIGLTMAVVQGLLVGRLTARFGSARVLGVGLASLALAMTLFGFQVRLNPGLPPLAWLCLTAALVSSTFSACNPSVLALIASLARQRAIGGTMGFTSSSATLGRIIGPLAGGVIYGAVGPEWPFQLGAALIALALLVFVGLAPYRAAPPAAAPSGSEG